MITLKNVSAGYDSRTIINHLSLSIKPGEFVHLLGSNGAGKSTLMNLLLGKILPTRGDVHIGEPPLNELSSLDLAQTIAYVSQNTLLGTVPTFTVQQNMELALLRGHKTSFKLRTPVLSHIKHQLSLCNLGLENQLNTKASDLSGGQRQALSLIMALQHPPKILLLDEHTSALDPNTAKRIMSLTHTMIKEHNITCVMITHNLQDAINYGDRILILHKGQIAKAYSKSEKSTLTHHDLIDVMLSIGG